MTTTVLTTAPSASRSEDGPGSGDVIASLNYYDDPGDGTPPEPVYVKPTTVTNKRATVAKTVTVHDITGRENEFTLDGHGFQLCRHQVKAKCLANHYSDDKEVEAGYYPEMEELLKEITGASRVFIFDHKTRHGPTNWHKLGAGNQSIRGPILRAHIDQSYDGAESLLRWLLPDEAESLLKNRFQIINAWRPIETIRKDPLAVCDATSVPEEDLVPAKIIYEDHERESWTVKHSPGHRWYFKYEQKPDEVLLIKCYDSETGVSRRAPHTAFQNPRFVDAEWRRSIEIRCMVFYSQ